MRQKKINGSQFLTFHILCKAELFENKWCLLVDFRLFHCFYVFFIFLVVIFSPNVQGKSHVKIFMGLSSITKIKLASIATDALSGQFQSAGNNDFNPLNGNLQAEFHINFHCCRIFVFILSRFIFNPQETWIQVLTSFIFLTHNNVVHINALKINLSYQCGENRKWHKTSYIHPIIAIVLWSS